MADLKISELPALAGTGLAQADVLPLTDTSASTSKKITAKDLVQYGVSLIDPKSIPSDKFTIVLADGSVETAALADNSVTAAKLADQSSGIVAATTPAAGDHIGQLCVATDENKLYVWEGSTWAQVQAAGSVNTVTGDTSGLILVAATKTGDTVNIVASLANTAGARQFLAGPTASGGAVTQRAITGLDLPLADTSVPGAVIVGGGLKVDSNGKVSINNSVVSQPARSLAKWNEFGLVTDGGPIVAADLPDATNSNKGAVVPGPSLNIDPSSGRLDIKNTMTAGSYAKVAVDQWGSVTAGENLEADDLPGIPADKISSGELDPARLAERSIEEIKLADYSTCYIQEGQPALNPKLGQFWYTPSTNQLRVYGRGSGGDIWLAVGFGALQANNLRWLGTMDAANSTVVALTAIGVSEGLKAGDLIPSPSDQLSGGYFVTVVEGSNVNHPDVSTDTFTEGDWMLCIDEAQGYVQIDAAAGGSGGGGVYRLGELLDVTLGGIEGPFKDAKLPGANPAIALAGRQYLMYESDSGMWVNSDVIDGGTY